MRKFFRPFLAGVIVTLLLLGFMTQISMNFQYILALGCGLFLLTGRLMVDNKVKLWIKGLLIISSFSILFVLLVIPQIKGFFYFPILFYLSVIGGQFLTRLSNVLVIISSWMIVLLLVSFWLIPMNIRSALTQSVDIEVPEMSFTSLQGEIINSTAFDGKIVVLDFFGTWCKPCIEELKVLDRVSEQMSKNDDVVFLVVNADLGGDTPLKFENFIKSKQYGFQYFYDHNSTAYNSLGMKGKGLPVLLIIDKEGRVRYQHIGYNTAETDFAEHLIETIASMQ